jgi:hypothetical protein
MLMIRDLFLRTMRPVAVAVGLVLIAAVSNAAQATAPAPASASGAPTCKSVLTKPIPSLQNRFRSDVYPEITLAENIVIEPLRVRHIFHGDLAAEPSKQNSHPVERLDGGMHTRDAFIDFLSFRPDLGRYLQNHPEMIQSDKNQVMTVMLPENAFTSRALSRDWASRANGGRGIVKTLFPPKWTNEMILSAIREGALSGVVTANTDSSQTKVINMYGVDVRVFLERKGKGWAVMTAYPVRMNSI